MSFFLSVIGMVMVVEGIPYFCFPSSVKSIAQKLLGLDDGLLRSMGFFLIVSGLAVIYIGRKVILS